MGVGSTLKALVLLYNKRGRAWPPAAWTRRVGKGKKHAFQYPRNTVLKYCKRTSVLP